ncbi:MAG: VCBS repeat-containing protein [Verrucomicrobia bacterium]|nr:VCBS repeat-containing protein [Verrucomicrobiota bacterium]
MSRVWWSWLKRGLPWMAAGWVGSVGAAVVEPLTVPSEGRPGFRLLSAAETGIQFTNRLSDRGASENQVRLNGSGVALGDVNGDGRCDVFLAGLESDNQLWLNRGGGRFEADTRSPAVACPGDWSTGAVLVDVDGDGDLDLLVSGIGSGVRLFLNDGTGGFTEAADSGLFRKGGSMTLALADVDGDGDLDLYVTNYRTTTIRSTGVLLLKVNGQVQPRPEDRNAIEVGPEGRILEHGEPDILYLNSGKGRFTPVFWTRGAFVDEAGVTLTRNPFDWGLTAMFRDLNRDGRPDLYVCNDFHSPDRVWLNESTPGQLRFRSAPTAMLRHTPTFSMAVDFADVDRDGRDDFLVADMRPRNHAELLNQLAVTDPWPYVPGLYRDRVQIGANTLQWAREDGTYADVAALAGIEATDWTWSVAFLDVDLDGYEDLLCTTGHGFNTQDQDAEAVIQSRGPWPREKIAEKLLLYPRLPQPRGAYRNRGDLTFELVSQAWGFDQVGYAQGLALADLDDDGDLDAVVNALNAPVAIYRNESPAPRIQVRLEGRAPNTKGIGARVTLRGGRVEQSQEWLAGGRYLSGDEAVRTFAAPGTGLFTVEVRWPGGGRSVVASIPPNSRVRISAQGASVDATSESTPVTNPWFEDQTARLGQTNQQAAFEDFARQPLLPYRLSTLSPGVTWWDTEQGCELVLSAGTTGVLERWRRVPSGRWERVASSELGREATTALPWGRELLVGRSSYREGTSRGATVTRWDGSSAGIELDSSGGPLALADVDADGDLDLFVGARVRPGRWPEASESRIWRQESGRFQADATGLALGQVSGALFSDLDDDGDADLITAADWGALRILRNERGQFSPWDPTLTGANVAAGTRLSGWVGPWTSVTAGDFDGDGRMDLLAGNWGANVPLAGSGPRIFHGEFGVSDTGVLPAVWDFVLSAAVPSRPLNATMQMLPDLRERIPTFAAFGRATVPEVLGPAVTKAQEIRSTCWRSVLLLNRGEAWEARWLPGESQFAPVFGIAVADWDGDGHEDAFLAQNLFGLDPTSSRLDAGRGVILRGNGRGDLAVVPAAISGVRVEGEGRGSAVADFDADGRVDLAVAQHGAETRLFRNALARPGIRVRLRGPEGNPQAVGASVRVVSSGNLGPRREVRAGSGYWSCDSAVLVLARPSGPGLVELEVRWPNGPTTRHPVGAEQLEVLVPFPK